MRNNILEFASEDSDGLFGRGVVLGGAVTDIGDERRVLAACCGEIGCERKR